MIEAYRNVEETPLLIWLARGQGDAFTVHRLKPPYQEHIPKLIEEARKDLGKPYDVRYEWDDEKIYCSELILKAYQRASGETLAPLKRLGEMNWKPFKSTIEHFEKGPAPLDRQIITPVALAESEHFDKVYAYGF